ncbi:hypothetical protein AVEN_48086-1, partial [Araneus ventricosus]
MNTARLILQNLIFGIICVVMGFTYVAPCPLEDYIREGGAISPPLSRCFNSRGPFSPRRASPRYNFDNPPTSPMQFEEQIPPYNPVNHLPRSPAIPVRNHTSLKVIIPCEFNHIMTPMVIDFDETWHVSSFYGF